MRAVISQLLQLIFRQPLVLSRQFSSITALIFLPKPVPEKPIYAATHGNHAERDGMAANESRLIKCRATWRGLAKDFCPNTGNYFWRGLLYERRHDSRCVSKSKLQTCCSCSFAISRGIIWQLLYTYVRWLFVFVGNDYEI